MFIANSFAFLIAGKPSVEVGTLKSTGDCMRFHPIYHGDYPVLPFSLHST